MVWGGVKTAMRYIIYKCNKDTERDILICEFYGNPKDWFDNNSNKWLEGKWLAKKK